MRCKNIGVWAAQFAVASTAFAPPATAQIAHSIFDEWALRLPLKPKGCPLIASQGRPDNPFFDYNGQAFIRPPEHRFSCHQAGPFRINGDLWWLQNIRLLQPPLRRDGKMPICKQFFSTSCRANSLRICSTKFVGHFTEHGGPFGGDVGPKGCEQLFVEEVSWPYP